MLTLCSVDQRVAKDADGTVFAIGSKLKIPPPSLLTTTTVTGGCPTLQLNAINILDPYFYRQISRPHRIKIINHISDEIFNARLENFAGHPLDNSTSTRAHTI
jgi:hypothetical protein